MYKTSTFVKGLLAISIAAMLCGYVLAAEQSTQRDRDKDQSSATQPQSQSAQTPSQQQRQPAMPEAAGPQSGMLHRTSKLIGKEVKNTQNEDLGKIYDLVLTPDHQQVSYVALSYGGTAGIGAKYFAVPWSAFQVNPQGNITTTISKSQLDQASGFDRSNWPAQPNWQFTSSTTPGQTFGQPAQMGTQRSTTDQSRESTSSGAGQTRPGQSMDRTQTQRSGTSDTDRTTGGQSAQAGSPSGTMSTDRSRQMMDATGTGMGARDAFMSRDVQYRRVSHLTGTPVKNPEGEDIGDIEDFVIDASQGQVAYAVISFGGFWGIGEKYAAVPATAIQIQPRRNVARIDADRDTLEKIAFDPDKFPDLSNREYAQRLHETFNAEPYWTVMGYVSPEQEQAAGQRAWGAEGQFAKAFDPKNIKTVQGTVQSVGSFLPEGAAPGASGGLRIRLTTDDGKLVTVYGGPMWYAQQNDFDVKPGDKISVTGAETKIGWRPVLVASQIKAGDRTLLLRSETGQPLWPGRQIGAPGSPQGTMGQRPGSSTQQQSGQRSSQSGSTSGQRQSGRPVNE